MGTPREDAFDKSVVPAALRIVRYLDRPLANIAELVWGVQVKLPGGATRGVATVLGWIDENLNRHAAKTSAQLAAMNATLTGLVGAMAAVNKGEPFDQAKLMASVQEAARLGAAEGVQGSIESVTRQELTTVTVKDDAAIAAKQADAQELQDLGELDGGDRA